MYFNYYTCRFKKSIWTGKGIHVLNSVLNSDIKLSDVGSTTHMQGTITRRYISYLQPGTTTNQILIFDWTNIQNMAPFADLSILVRCRGGNS